MKKLKVLIVDDEAPARRKRVRQFSEIENAEIVGEAKDGAEALEMIATKAPDLVMLDIQMPGMTGFDVIRLLEEPRPGIIFVTAYDEYAIKAFEVAATDYLLNPVSNQRLNQAIEKVTSNPSHPDEVLDVLEQPTYAKRLAARHLKRIKLVQVTDINYITSEHRMVYIVDKNGNRFWTNETLDQLTRRLDPDQFFRIHRSSILNLASQFEIEPWDDGRLKVHFADDTFLTVAREPATALKKLLEF